MAGTGDDLPTAIPPAPGLAEKAYAVLEDWIVNRQIPPGSMISENRLSEQLGMGRTPIREALQRLQHIGFVEVHPRRGAVVAGVDVVRQLELIEVRRPLEELMVRCAAQRAAPEERRTLKALARDIAEAAQGGDAARWFRADRLIAETEARAAHNEVLLGTVQAIQAQSRRCWYGAIRQSNGFGEGAKRHDSVIAALVEGDADLAASSARKLVNFLERMTKGAVERYGR